MSPQGWRPSGAPGRTAETAWGRRCESLVRPRMCGMDRDAAFGMPRAELPHVWHGFLERLEMINIE